MYHPPDESNDLWPEGKSAKGLEGNTHIFCPVFRHFTGVIPTCYGCGIGYNGQCESLNSKIENNPKILEDIYRPFPELSPRKLRYPVVFYEGSFYKVKDAHKLKDKKKVYVVTGKFSVTIRFIPKFEEVNYELSDQLFATYKNKTIFSLERIPEYCSSGNSVFTVKQDAKVI